MMTWHTFGASELSPMNLFGMLFPKAHQKGPKGPAAQQPSARELNAINSVFLEIRLHKQLFWLFGEKHP